MFHQPSLHTPVWCLRHLDSCFSPTSCRPLHHSLVQGDLLLLGLPSALGLLSVLVVHDLLSVLVVQGDLLLLSLPSVLVVHGDQAPHLVHPFHPVLAVPQCKGRSLCSHLPLHSECQHSSVACPKLQLKNRVQYSNTSGLKSQEICTSNITLKNYVLLHFAFIHAYED